MLTICNFENDLYYSLLSSDLVNIINEYEPQSATELFHKYGDFPADFINDQYVFHYIARNINDLRILLSFFDKFKLVGKQSIRLKTIDITQDEIDHVLYEFYYSSVVDKLLIDVTFDKSGDFIDAQDFDQMRLIINDIKSAIPKDATNLEIIIYVYNWLKKREYKHDETKPDLSKRYSSALLTEYIVCVGFSKIFNNVLSEYNIEASEYQYHLLIDGEEIGHDISIVKVQDKKYEVDGLYFFDLTRDCYNPNSRNDYKYSGFMMTYEDVCKDTITKDMFNKMLLWDSKDIKDTIDTFKPEIKKLTIYDDSDDFDENISSEIRQLVFNLMQIDGDLFGKEKTVDMFCLGNPNGAMYFICSYILFLKNKLGEKVKDGTIIDLLVNTMHVDNPGYYLAAINSYNPNDDYNNEILQKHHQYIKKRLETIR